MFYDPTNTTMSPPVSKQVNIFATKLPKAFYNNKTKAYHLKYPSYEYTFDVLDFDDGSSI
jgi:hypothetical protein